MTINAETHIGLGVLDDKLIVGATLAGYDATPDNTAKLVALARMQASPQRGPLDASLRAFEDIAAAAARWGLPP